MKKLVIPGRLATGTSRSPANSRAGRSGITSFFMHDVRELGIETVVERTVEPSAQGPST